MASMVEEPEEPGLLSPPVRRYVYSLSDLMDLSHSPLAVTPPGMVLVAREEFVKSKEKFQERPARSQWQQRGSFGSHGRQSGHMGSHQSHQSHRQRGGRGHGSGHGESIPVSEETDERIEWLDAKDESGSTVMGFVQQEESVAEFERWKQEQMAQRPSATMSTQDGAEQASKKVGEGPTEVPPAKQQTLPQGIRHPPAAGATFWDTQGHNSGPQDTGGSSRFSSFFRPTPSNGPSRNMEGVPVASSLSSAPGVATSGEPVVGRHPKAQQPPQVGGYVMPPGMGRVIGPPPGLNTPPPGFPNHAMANGVATGPQGRPQGRPPGLSGPPPAGFMPPQFMQGLPPGLSGPPPGLVGTPMAARPSGPTPQGLVPGSGRQAEMQNVPPGADDAFFNSLLAKKS